jgi:hypothetical protein
MKNPKFLPAIWDIYFRRTPHVKDVKEEESVHFCTHAPSRMKLLGSSCNDALRLTPLLRFPNAAHNDMVDAWGQAASRFRASSSGLSDYYREEAQLAAPVGESEIMT